MSIVIWLLTFVLVLLSVFLVLVVLMQKSKSDGGVGAALGGGMTEATFGADTGNILATLTRNGTIVFFVLSFGLYLAHIYRHQDDRTKVTLPSMEAEAEVPAATAVETPAAPESGETAISVPAPETVPAPAEPAN
jgi:protein translocase, SecG subunit